MINFTSILNAGITSENSAELNDKIRLTNIIAVFSIPLCFTAIFIGVAIMNSATIWSFTITAAFYLFVPTMNHFGLTKASRLSSSILPTVLYVVPTWLIGEVVLGHMFAYSYAVLGLVLIPCILFDYRTERVSLFVSIAIHLIFLLGYDWLLIGKLGMEDQEIFWSMYTQVKLAQLILFTFMIGVSLLMISKQK